MNAKNLKKGNYVIHEGSPYFISSVSIENNAVKVILHALFSEEIKNLVLDFNEGFEEADVARKTASILFKKKGKLEIMDSYDFLVHKVEVDKEMFENAVEGDMVTYIKFNESVRILELRK